MFAQNQTVDGCVGEHSGAFRSLSAKYLPQELAETKKQSQKEKICEGQRGLKINYCRFKKS